MSSLYSSALASRSPLILFLFWLPRLLFSVSTQGCCWCSRQTTKYPRNPGPTPCPACAALLRHSLTPAFLPIWLCGCYSLCLQKHALGLHTAHKGPKCPSNDRVRNAPSTQDPRHVPRAWHCFGKAYPLPFLPILAVQLLFPVYRGMPLVGGVGHVNRVRRC